MRNTPITKLTLAAAIAAAGLATSATAQDAQAPKVSSTTTIMKSGDGQSYEIKLQDGQVVTFKLNGKNVDPDSYKVDTEGGFIVLKDGDHEPIIIDIPHFNMNEFPGGFAVVPGVPSMPAVPGVARVAPAPGADNIHWFDGPDAPEPPAAIAWAGEEPPKVMIGITHDEVSDELRNEFGLKDGEGIYVIEVRKDLPADKAGIESGDVIIEVDGQRISKRDVLMDVMKKHEPGDKLTVIVLRDGEKKKLKLELAPYNADRLGAPRALTLRSTEPGRFNIRINDDDMEFGDMEPFGDLEDFEPFGDFDFDFDMEGLPPEAKAELERALRNAREQANEARARAFVLRRDAQGQRELQELKLREHGDHVQEQAARIREHAERLSTDNRDRALEMQKLEERLAKLRELGENDRLFRAAPNGRAFIIEREDDARGLAEVKPEIQELMVQRDSLTARNRELEARVDQLERKLEELMKRLEKNESGRTR